MLALAHRCIVLALDLSLDANLAFSLFRLSQRITAFSLRNSRAISAFVLLRLLGILNYERLHKINCLVTFFSPCEAPGGTLSCRADAGN